MTGTDVYEWFMRVTVDRNALGGSFAVVAFLLPPSEANKENASSVIPTKPSEWPRSSYYIGKVAAIPTSLEPTGPDDEPLLIQGFIHLDDAIQEKSGKTERSSVVEYLRKGLFWKVTSPETPTEEPKDEEYDIDKLPSLEVKVTSARLRNQKGGFPDHDPPVEHPEITEGKKGGWKR